MARSLNLDENCFLKQFGERAQLQASFNYYSSCKRPDLVLGLKPHADGTGYTIVLQDEVGSVVHRAVSDSKRIRISITTFYTPEAGKEIGPEEGLIGIGASRLYK
ncbi:hypothetical protein BUALT_Bualt07G0125300 [Buddleja alternifolia]|uniref:Isopenicillin N synthase-like Fe(2+) 2OG dioxygenase domain-containing protein n=1 Tax=Buddleja alternifolia TaxID=168488 RepID=A0AAV6XBI9_9LAMI|nr:hypothetical protein BUALT_Bualt07G0125300 [Buddleja alternifolia]